MKKIKKNQRKKPEKLSERDLGT
ncbi:hypothetical protein MUY_000626 [Bacillus licheniformis WX-02]|nr:hypothetical protein MUY_000626 [Bacillus licheniformis WX-02]